MSYAYIFEGRKPSTKQVLAKIREAQDNGENLIEIYWGENSITLEYANYAGEFSWNGWGWIKEISGQGIAEGKNAFNKAYGNKQ
jgi:hypothetical protein